MMKTTRLKDGNCISMGVIEVTAIPSADTLGEDRKTALLKNSTAFSGLITMTIQMAGQQDVVAELLCAAIPVKGQVYKAKPCLFIILRRYGNSRTNNENIISVLLNNYIKTLRSNSYTVIEKDPDDAGFQTVVNSINESAVYTMEKQIRKGTNPGQMGYALYMDSMNADNLNGLEGVYNIVSDFPGTAFSFMVIPTEYTQAERTFIEGVNYCINAPIYHGRSVPYGNDVAEYYRAAVEDISGRLCLTGMVIMGSQESASAVAGRLSSSLPGTRETEILQRVDRSGRTPSYKRTLPMFPWNMMTEIVQRTGSGQTLPAPFRRFPHLMKKDEVLSFFHLPVDDGNLTGFSVNRIRAVRETFRKNVLDGNNIQFGFLMGTGEGVPFGAPLKSFTRHALVVGMPGTGKTTFSVNLLLQFNRRGIPFIAIEPTKAEYRAMIDAIPDLQVFTPGKNSVVPFIINPFMPPKGISLELFKPSLVSAFRAAFSMPSPLDILFANAIDTCYVKHGWRSYSKSDDPEAKAFGIHEFVLTFREIIRKSSYSSETKGNMESAGVFRLLDLVIQNGNIYDTEKTIPLSDLLTRPTIIELNAIDNQEQKALIMALLLINIVLYTKHTQAGDGELKNILLIDEAHVLLGGSTNVQEGMAETSATTVKALQNMIVEIRSYGTGIIIADQSPQKVTKEIVGNTDVKVMFQLVQPEDKHLIAASSNMTEEDEENLSKLDTGEAYIYYRGLEEPKRIRTEDIREKDNIRLVVSDEELHRRMHYWENRQDMLKPYEECSVCDVCQQCDFRIRDDAKYYVSQMFMRDKALLKDKTALVSYILTMEKRLSGIIDKASVSRQLLMCMAIRFIRKAALETPAVLSDTEIVRVLKRVCGDVQIAEQTADEG